MVVFIDKKPLVFSPNFRCTVLEACLFLNIKIPNFCYHASLLLEGNCRMCLIELENLAKPQASCCLPLQNGMKIYTNTPLVQKARENILEFLLINHPLDCPICDQGGECDLQDQSFNFGSDTTRFLIKKRSVSNKTYNSFIKTIMNRCIHCTKCIRFSTEFLGVTVFGTLFRGKFTEIGNFIKSVPSFEFSGNLIDICPVGALTSKPQAFMARPWDIKSNKSLDLFDSFGVNIRIDLNIKKNNIYRILPKQHKILNLAWINDRIRFSYDIENQKLNNLNKIALQTFQTPIKILKLSSKNEDKLLTEFNFDSNNNIYTLFLIKFLTVKNNFSFNLCEQSEYKFKILNTFSSNYIFTSFTSFKALSTCFIFGLNPKIEASYIYLTLIQEQQKQNIKLFNFGFSTQVNLKILNLGFKIKKFKNFFIFKFVKFQNFEEVMFLFNSFIFTRFDGISIYKVLTTYLVSQSPKLKLNLISLYSNQIANLHFNTTSKNYNFKNINTLYHLETFNSLNVQQRNFKLLLQHTTELPTKNIQKFKPIQFTTVTPNNEIGEFINLFGFKQKILPISIQAALNKTSSNLIFKLLKTNLFLTSTKKKFYNLIHNKIKFYSIFKSLDFQYFKYNFLMYAPLTPSLELFYKANTYLKQSINLKKYTAEWLAIEKKNFNF